MSYSLHEEVFPLIKELIHTLSGLQNETDTFKHVEKNILYRLKNVDNLFYTNEKELERIIESLSRKFIFHGFNRHAKELKRVYDKLTPKNLSTQDRINRLNVIMFLLGVSESPTSNVHKYPQEFQKGDDVDVTDWPKYLKEGVPRWSPILDNGDSSDCFSDDVSDDSTIEDKDVCDDSEKYNFQQHLKQGKSEDCFVLYNNSKANLLTSVQSEWFNYDRVCFKPVSDDRNANLALLWDDFIQYKTGGLIATNNSNVFTEYKIMREIIWQLYQPFTSSCFKFNRDALIPKLNVTISSVRTGAFEKFLYEFVPYIGWLQTLRDFHDSLVGKYGQSKLQPDTYRSYDFAIQTIINPIFNKLKTIEDKIKTQETTMTLLSLAQEIRPFFQMVRVLNGIHTNVILNVNEHSPVECATTLLYRLHNGLLYVTSKLAQDLHLTLYLHSLYKYFTIINSWLSRDVLEDHTGEFVIADENPKAPHAFLNRSLINQWVCMNIPSKIQHGQQDWQMQFVVKNFDEQTKSDYLIKLICTHVLQIGKNIHLLRLLGKLNLVPEFTGVYKESFYQAYVNRVLEKISVYFDGKKDENEEVVIGGPEPPWYPSAVFPGTCGDDCKYLTEMDRLQNLVDTDDGFLVKAFESFFIKKPEVKEVPNNCTLFEKISGTTKKLFPAQEMIDDIFVEMLHERFSISGIMVKNVLIEDYDLKKQFSFLRNVFLFSDDLIFPLYRRIFKQLDHEGIWGNHTWLTSHLQDIIMDGYPNFYKDCSIEVKDNWKLCTDPLKACNMINIHYHINWPVNIIIRDEHMDMYENIFKFILKIKWALYTLNHLYFFDLRDKGKLSKDEPKSLRIIITKLKILRFGLLNIFSNIQHYILGHVFNKNLYKFEKMLEDAYDLESLRKAHADFVVTLHATYNDFQEYKSSDYGFYLLLYVVRKIRIMWKNIGGVTSAELDKCEKSYLMCHKNIDPIINPSGSY